MKYQIIVGNIGTTYDGDNWIEALRQYGEYKRQSKAKYGRCAGEPVAIMKDGEIMSKYDYPGETE